MSIKYKEFPMEIKTEDVSDEGYFKGIASPFGGKPDSQGDIIVQGAFQETLASGGRNGFGIAMLWSHNSSEPIGTWISMVEREKGLMVEGKLTKGVQRADETHLLMKDGAVRGLSIGYDTRDGLVEYDDKKKIRYIKKLNLWEVSPVVFPAATRAQITNVKSLIEEATNIRELERALRDSGMSRSEALNVISICKLSTKDVVMRDSIAKMEMLRILNSLKSMGEYPSMSEILYTEKEFNTFIQTKFTGSPRNKYGTHASKGFKGNYAGAWRCHFSKVGGGATTGRATGPLRGTVRRTEMIAAKMKPKCSLPSTDSISARSGPKSPLTCSFSSKPSDYGLSRWANPSDDNLTREDIQLTCSDLIVIKRAALAEIKRRAKDREGSS